MNYSLINKNVDTDKMKDIIPRKPNDFLQPSDLIMSTESDERPHPT